MDPHVSFVEDGVGALMNVVELVAFVVVVVVAVAVAGDEFV